MLNKMQWTLAEAGRTAVILLAGIALAGPAVAGNIYSWRTHDGDVAYTDNIKNVPSRYLDQVETRATEPLGGYERYSSQDPEGVEDYASRLQERLIHLQWLNDALERQVSDRPIAVGTATLQIGGSSDPVLNLTGAAGDEPIIVERIRVRRDGQIATRHDTVVRQGNRTLAIMRGNQEGETDAVSNILSENDLLRY